MLQSSPASVTGPAAKSFIYNNWIGRRHWVECEHVETISMSFNYLVDILLLYRSSHKSSYILFLILYLFIIQIAKKMRLTELLDHLSLMEMLMPISILKCCKNIFFHILLNENGNFPVYL